MKLTTPKGTFDIIPKDPDTKNTWRNSYYWQYVEDIIRHMSEYYGFKEIRTPIFERTELFKRSVGETTDIVSKEMYTFKDKADRLMTLRPEGTAAVMRSVIEKNLLHSTPFLKFFYLGPMFRYERPQSGRYRQHHQFGIETIGYHSPESDVEIIDMVYSLYSKLGLKGLTIHLNSLGNKESRTQFRKALCDYLQPILKKLSSDSQKRFETNPLRILDSKEKQDQDIIANAPSILDHLDETSTQHFNEVQNLLKTLKIPYTINAKLVRGLDYYTDTVFEITSQHLGAQNSLGGGGRYDGLIKTLGGPDVPAVGFAMGMERVIQTMLAQKTLVENKKGPKIFFIGLGEKAKNTCFSFLHDLRNKGITAEMDFSNKKLKNVMQYANTLDAEYVIIIGDEELSSHEAAMKCMADGKTEKISFDNIIGKFTDV